jgi:hypothetical protein
MPDDTWNTQRPRLMRALRNAGRNLGWCDADLVLKLESGREFDHALAVEECHHAQDIYDDLVMVCLVLDRRVGEPLDDPVDHAAVSADIGDRAVDYTAREWIRLRAYGTVTYDVHVEKCGKAQREFYEGFRRVLNAYDITSTVELGHA